MAKLPKSIASLIDAFERLPGVGPKSAARLVFYLLNTPEIFLKEFAGKLADLKSKTKYCRECFSVGEEEVCEICRDPRRNRNLICVVEKPLDMLAIEGVGGFDGVYHVLGGVVNPLDHVSPEDLKIEELTKRVEGLADKTEVEVILAVNMTMEGEATALYIKNQISKIKNKDKVKITRIGSGLPIGADLGYADQATLSRAMEGKRAF